MIDCPHGLGPMHLLFDFWWLLLVVLSSPYMLAIKGRLLKKKKSECHTNEECNKEVKVEIS